MRKIDQHKAINPIKCTGVRQSHLKMFIRCHPVLTYIINVIGHSGAQARMSETKNVGYTSQSVTS